MKRIAMLLVLSVWLGACGLFGMGATGLVYNVTATATGTVPIALVSLGQTTISAGGVALLDVVVGLAGQFLTKSANLKGCKFTAYPPDTTGGQITVTASAVCQLNGQEVNETVAVSLTPVPPLK